MASFKLPYIVRFWNFVMPEPNSGCWLWMGALVHGYGQFVNNITGKRAHMFSYSYYKGAIPEGMVVMHKCDVRCCVNPDHLIVGTQKENVRDCISKGRYLLGEARGVFTNAAIIEMRRMWATGKYTQQMIATKFGTFQSVVGRIVNRQTWKHI